MFPRTPTGPLPAVRGLIFFLQRRSTAAKIACVLVAAILTGCGILGPGKLNLEQSKVEVQRLAREGFDAGSVGALERPEGELSKTGCGGDSIEIMNSWDYAYLFPLELLGPDPDAFAERVAKYWESEGFELFRRKNSSEVTGSFAEGKGFNLEVFVNRRTGMALVGVNGPCFPEPQPELSPL